MDKYDHLPPKWAFSASSFFCLRRSQISVMSFLVLRGKSDFIIQS